MYQALSRRWSKVARAYSVNRIYLSEPILLPSVDANFRVPLISRTPKWNSKMIGTGTSSNGNSTIDDLSENGKIMKSSGDTGVDTLVGEKFGDRIIVDFSESPRQSKYQLEKWKISLPDALFHIGDLEAQLKLARRQLLERDGSRMLRTHVELLEAMYLASYPMPSSSATFKKQLAERKNDLATNADLLSAIDKELTTEIKWPASIDVELKDAFANKINKHFRNWIWLLYMVDSPEIDGLRNAVSNNSVAIRHLASGIAGLYIYASVEIRELKNYSKEEIRQYGLTAIKTPMVRSAADLLLEQTWED